MNPSATIRIRRERAARYRREFVDLARRLDDQIWANFYGLMSERYADRARAFAWFLILGCAGALAASALRGCL